MKIQANGEEKISVTLSKNDMTDFDITYDELDYSNIETRRVIWTILDEAKKVLGKSVNIDNRLLIQVSPADDGGCFLEFTQLPEPCDTARKRLIMKKDSEPVLFTAFDGNAFMDSLELLHSFESLIKNTDLILYEGSYCAVIYPKPTATEGLVFSLCEFGEACVSSKKELAEIYEYGNLLLPPA